MPPLSNWCDADPDADIGKTIRLPHPKGVDINIMFFLPLSISGLAKISQEVFFYIFKF